MKPVLIVGSGFSGLSLAYWLTRNDIPCEIWEEKDSHGGLIHSEKSPFGLVETAANGFLANESLLEMCSDLKVPLAARKNDRKKRYIFRNRPRRWPLGVSETFQLLWKLFTHLLFGFKRLKPKPGESIQVWALRCFNESTLNWLIAPALQGVYAGQVKTLSANLVFNKPFIKQKIPRDQRGTLSPEGGMGQLIQHLVNHLKEKGVQFSFGKHADQILSKDNSAVVLAVPGWRLGDIQIDSERIFQKLKVESLPLVSATLFFEKSESDLKGFGCLFPKSQGFYSLGVLFNSSIFENRSHQRSETWILGGALNKDIVRFSEDEILRQIKADRLRLDPNSKDKVPVHYKITKWDRALPNMSLELEQSLNELKLPKNVHLTGNYLGSIGLSQIVNRNKLLAQVISKDLKGVKNG